MSVYGQMSAEQLAEVAMDDAQRRLRRLSCRSGARAKTVSQVRSSLPRMVLRTMTKHRRKRMCPAGTTHALKDDMTNTAKLDTMIKAVRKQASDITVGGRRPRFSVVCTQRTSPDTGLFEARQSCGSGTNKLGEYHAQIRRDGSVTVEVRS